MMIVFFIVLFGISIIYFIYEGILVPSLRFKFRLKLFELRDRLRLLKVVYPKQLDRELYHYLQDSINISIRIMHQIDLKTIFWVNKSVEDDKQLYDEIQKRLTLINQCNLVEVREIAKSLYTNVGYLLLINNGALFVWIVPFFLAALFFQKLKSQLKNLVNIPEKKMEQIIPLEGIASP